MNVRWEYFWAIIALIIAIVLAYVLVSVTDDGAKTQASEQCVDETTRGIIRELALSGADEGFKKHVEHLFEVWVRDPSEQPKRAKRGVQMGINAFVRARADILTWEPPVC